MTAPSLPTLARGLVLACLAAAVSRAATVTAPAPATPPPTSMITFDDGKGSVSIVDRSRWEDRDNNFDFDSSAKAPTDGTWLLNRLRLGATWKPESDLSLQVQLQDVREWGSNRPKVPFIQGAEGNEPLNLHVASLTYGSAKDPFQFTLGRQVIALGEERLVGPGEWNNFARVFDAGKLVWNMIPGQATTTFFVSSVVNVEPTTSGAPWKLEHSSGSDLFSGAYFSDKATKRDTFEAFLFWRDKTNNDPIYTAPTAPIPAPARASAAYDIAQDIYTLGGRYLRTPKPGAFDAETEIAVQWGNVNRQTTAATGSYAGTTPTLTQDSFAIHTLLGYMPEGAPGKLRFDVEYNVASGDTNRNDNKNGSFMTLFPSGHKWYGFMDAESWKNLREAVATARFNLTPEIATRIDYHNFSLYSNQDAWYRKNGVSTVRPLNAAAQNAPTHAGDELDVTATWTPCRWATVDLGWCRFFAGSYLGATGARSDADFFYAQTTLTF